jgi:hypothetical protein
LEFITPKAYVLISSLRTGELFIYDANTHKDLKRLNTGRGAAGILVDPDGFARLSAVRQMTMQRLPT